MHKLLIGFISLFLGLSAFACNPGQGTGQCGYYDNTGYHNAPIGSGGNYSGTYSSPRTVVIRLPSKYGAVAMNDTGFATSFNATSERKAKKEALSKCQRGGQVGCKVYFTVRNGCFSGAFGHYENGLVKAFFESTDNQGESENAVLQKCYRYNEYKFQKCTIFIPERCALPG